MRVLAEATLALVLFADASRIDLGALRRTVGVPVRLLGLGLPLTIVLGGGGGGGWFREAERHRGGGAGDHAGADRRRARTGGRDRAARAAAREGLNVESGLNDGICVALLFAAVAVADVNSKISGGRSPGTLLLEEIGYGIVGGVVAGLLIAAIFRSAGRRDLIAPTWKPVIAGAGAALAYGIANALHGSGFIAAFVGGMVFRRALGRDPEELNRLTEEVGSVLNGVTFILFGAVLLGSALAEFSWQLVLYAVLSLTLVRMLPVAVVMLGSHARPPTLAFLGWFGPRGLASIVFAVILIDESNLPHQHLIVLAVYITVWLSVLADGLSAAPLAKHYGRWYDRHQREKRLTMESAEAELTRPRGPVDHHEPQGLRGRPAVDGAGASQVHTS